MAYLLAASGMLAILAAVGSAHGGGYLACTLERKSRQLTLLSDLIRWSYCGAGEDQCVNNLLAGLSGQSIGSSPASMLAVLFDEEKGSMAATLWSAANPGEFQHALPGEHTSDLKTLFRLWRDPLPRTYHAGEPVNQWVRELLAGPDNTRVVCFPVHAAGNTFGMIGVATTDPSQLDLEDHQRLVDVTALCLLNTRRQEAQARQNRELQQQDLLRRSFLSYVTHEFRTPLASLQTSFELIQEAEVMRGLDDPYQRLLVNVNRSIAILGQLINDMAEAANLSAGGVVLDRTETPPAAIVYPVIETTSPLSRLKNQILEVDIRPGLPNLMADARRLEQVLTNMVSNAIKYTPPGGTIRTVVSQEEGLIKFAVSDSGRGIPREDLDRVFDPFFRVPQQSNDRTPGTGLGLALAKSLVELHGGNIWAESEPKKGSTFFFTIPLG
jgi:signal transduction histidine kinase